MSNEEIRIREEERKGIAWTEERLLALDRLPSLKGRDHDLGNAHARWKAAYDVFHNRAGKGSLALFLEGRRDGERAVAHAYEAFAKETNEATDKALVHAFESCIRFYEKHDSTKRA